MQGIVSGSVIVFLIMFISGLVFGRAWCGWLCPIAGLSEMGMLINNRPVSVRKLSIIRYIVFAVWFLILISGFILAGGVKGINPLHLSDNIISVTNSYHYITYYLVLFIFGGLTLWLGRRGACHSICWMSPFLVSGYILGRYIRLPQLRIKSKSDNCIDCKKCDGRCPMSINVSREVKSGEITSVNCILCGECIDSCPKKVLNYGIRKK